MNMEMKNCNQCPNQCPVDALRCGRGRAYFAQMENGEVQGNAQDSPEEGRHVGRHGGHGEGRRWEEGGHWEGRHDQDKERHGHGNENRHGREWHGSWKGNREQRDENTELYELMRMCGHYLYHNAGQKQGSGMGQNRVLKILAGREQEGRTEMTQKELQDILQIQAGSLSEMLSKMEAKELIQRSKSTEDHRVCSISLTDKGKEEALQKHRKGGENEMFSALNDAERENLKVLLKKLVDSWKQD